MLSLVLSHSPELWHPVKGPHQSWVHRPKLKGHASSIGVPGSRYRVWTWRPAEWARGCCPLHPQWHWWDWTGRSGGPSSHGSSPGPPCWDPGKNSPLCPDGGLPGKRRGHPIFHKNHFKAFVSISSCHLQQTFLFFCFFCFGFFFLIYGCVGSSFLCEGFLQLRQAGATLHRGARASHYRGLSCCGAQAPDAQAQQLWLTGPVAPRHVGSSQTRARTRVARIGRQTPNHCATREALQQTFRGHGPSRWIPPKPPFLKCSLPLPRLWPW